MLDAKELRNILGMITPDDAVSQEKLDAGCDYAMTRLDEVMAYADKAAAGSMGFHAAREERVRAIAKRLRSIRREWLIENDGYRYMMAMG